MQMLMQEFLLKVLFSFSSYQPLSPSCKKHRLISHHTVLICAEIAAKQGHGDVSKLTPTDIAIEVLYHHSCSTETLQRGHNSNIFALICNHT
jgi:hypothetical protein